MQLEFHQLDRRLEHLRAGNPERQHRLVASLAASGQQSPIVVVESAGRFLVIDGYKRIAALQQLGHDTVQATVWAMSEAEALLLDRTLRLSQPETALEQGWLLREMEQRYGHSLEQLARRLDRSISWVSRRLALVELLPEAIQRQVRDGTIAAQLAMKYLVPVARVNVEDCERMAAAFAAHHWNTREAGQLYTAWRGGSRVVRARILAAPELFLKTQRQPPAPAASALPPATQAAALERDLEMAVAIVERAGRRLAEAMAEMNGKQLDQVQHRIGQARRELERMAQRMNEGQEERHAESGTTSSDSGDAPAGSEQARDRACVEAVAAERTQGATLQLQHGPAHSPPGEGRTVPATDSRSAESVQGESRAGP
jgi:ParB/RepB/Spo0J family partition protein